MIHYVTGKLTHATPSLAIVEAGGIGYKVFIPASVYTKLPQVGSQVLLHTSHVIREVSQTLYGFLDSTERDLFEEVTSVSGIGPKTALNLIGHLPFEQMEAAVSKQDVHAISRVPGIGKKTAERLIIEMRDKLSKKVGGTLPKDFAISLPPGDPQAEKISDAINALLNLGYNQQVAQKAVKKTVDAMSEGEGADLPTLITSALKHV